MNNSKKASIELLDYDSTLFGYSVVQIAPDSFFDRSEAESMISHLRGQGIRLAYIKVAENSELNPIVEALCGTAVDEKVTYVRSIKDMPPVEIVQSIQRYDSDTPDRQLYSLALQSGEFSRFKTDARFSRGEYEKLYKQWIEKSVSKEIAEEVFVYKEAGENIGMVTLQRERENVKIGLFAVDEQKRGRSIGASLLDAVFSQTLEWHGLHVIVPTQRKNIGACRFYRRMGFTELFIEKIYHLWL